MNEIISGILFLVIVVYIVWKINRHTDNLVKDSNVQQDSNLDQERKEFFETLYKKYEEKYKDKIQNIPKEKANKLFDEAVKGDEDDIIKKLIEIFHPELIGHNINDKLFWQYVAFKNEKRSK